MEWLIALAVKPLVFLLIVGCVLYPIRRLLMRFLPEGLFKRILLLRLS